MKKKTGKRYILWGLLACLVAVLAVMPLAAAGEQENSGPQASILSASVRTGNLEAVLRGGGTLSAGEAAAVELPSGVKITEFLVNNGDTVDQGDPVAKVDSVSVMNAIVQVQSAMDILRSRIDGARDDTLASTLRAAAGGRVKQVFAREGDSVAEVMLRHGALAVLSLDGKMAVQLQTAADLAAGDPVRVTLESGEEISGRVESSLGGTLTLTVEDAGYAVGEAVTVSAPEGEVLGSGSLYVHNAWKLTGFSGTVKTVYAKPEQTVSDGTALFSLTDTQYTGDLETASSQYEAYARLLQELFRMYESGVLTAPCGGTVSGVEEDSPFLLSAIDGEQGWFVDLLDTGTQPTGWKAVLLSAFEPVLCTGTDTEGNCLAQEHQEGCALYCTGRADCPAFPEKKHDITCLSLCLSAEKSGVCTAVNHRAQCIEKCEGAALSGECPALGAHKPGCIESCISTDGKQDCPATGTHKADCLERCDRTQTCFATVHHYPECVSLCTGDEGCTALNHREGCYMARLSYYAWAGLVRQVGASQLIVAADTQTRYTLKTGAGGWELVEPKKVNLDLLITEQTVDVADPAAFQPGDVVLFWTGYSGETPVKTGQTRVDAGQTQGGSQEKPDGTQEETQTGSGQKPGGAADISGLLGGMTGGLTGGMGSMGGGMTAGAQDAAQTLYPLEGEVLLTVTDNTAMTLTVTLDEGDIASAYVGQPAQVEVTALKGQSFEAQVTGIGMEGTGNGGSSKFTVELTLPWQEDMLSGMNATAVIPLYTKMEVLTLPVAALTELRDKTVVYTALDPETGEPAAPVEVTAGLSDGETVEILAGLNAGDPVYYSYYDTLELDNTAKAEQRFGF